MGESDEEILYGDVEARKPLNSIDDEDSDQRLEANKENDCSVFLNQNQPDIYNRASKQREE